MRRVAFCTVPHIGGIYSVYQRMRTYCASNGWDVRCVYPANEVRNWNGFDRQLADDGVVELGNPCDTLESAAKNFVSWVQDNRIEIVVPMTLRASLSSVPHLPPSTKVISRCINVTPHAYRLASAFQSRTSRIVVTSPRQRRDLEKQYGVNCNDFAIIPNSVDTQRFNVVARTHSSKFRILVLDRLEDLQKSIFMIPQVLRALEQASVDWQLDVVGSGPDEVEFQRRLQDMYPARPLRFWGKLPLAQVASVLPQADVLLKPSKNEGFPSSVIEAMACGCVPVVSKISGVTDWIVSHQENGMLCRMGDVRSFGDSLVHLAKDRILLSRLSDAAARSAASRFNAEAFGNAWSSLFDNVCSEERAAVPPVSWDEFELASPFRPRGGIASLYRLIPRATKERIRMAVENFKAR